MLKLQNAFLGLNVWLKIILVFCLCGALANVLLLWHDVRAGGVLLRLHLGFFILYAAQAVFILLKERMVGVLSLLQALLALWTNADFTFAFVVRVLGRVYYLSHQMSVQEISVYKYVFVSLAFTLELLKTYILFTFLPPAAKKKSAVSVK